ncbi:hypothetical protein FRB94_010218 [Tulasnella sp. JGI-2019a]|nr:hypothetical protein FRB93_005324 [Tulasnella sp. JGI-2019a]KAG8993982.1 hypothetical protein FRB94_010218 [Tulasnella sp. JGI-2019a]KAG9029387.1 hypothetical protein FRB95_005342 [Tulasnella sp. JGI-2019a]
MHISTAVLAGIGVVSSLAVPVTFVVFEDYLALLSSYLPATLSSPMKHLQATRPHLEVDFEGNPPNPNVKDQITNAVAYFWMSKSRLTDSDSAIVTNGAWRYDDLDPMCHATVMYSGWPYQTHVYQDGTGNLRPDLGVPMHEDDAKLAAFRAIRPSFEVKFLRGPPNWKIMSQITNTVTYFRMNKTELTDSDSAIVASGAWNYNDWDPRCHATVMYAG